jgi:hypothetical protein
MKNTAFEALKRAGWKSDDNFKWTRPGKESGISAIWTKSLHVFTSNAPPFEADHKYDSSQILLLLALPARQG